MPRYRINQRAAGVGRPKGSKPGRTLAQNGRHGGEAQRVVDGGGRAVQAEIRRERRLEARLAGLALERVEQRRLLAADVRAGADEGGQVEVDAAPQHVPAEQSRRIGFRERRLEARHRLAEKLAANVVVGNRGGGGGAGDCQALDEGVRVGAQDVAVGAGAGLALDRKSTRLNSSHDQISYAVFCLKKKKKTQT